MTTNLLPLTLAQLFGENASQDINQLVIHKADLPRLTVSPTNRAEQLLVAILLKILENFEGNLKTETGENITDESGRIITYKNSELFKEMSLLEDQIYFVKKNELTKVNTFILHTFKIYEY